MDARVCFVFIVACASPPRAHTIAPASSASAASSEAHWPSAPADRASVVSSLKALHAVVEAWRANHADECPTVQRLIDERELAASTSVADPWGSPYKIVCEEDATRAISFGADRREGTADDVAVP